MPRKRKPQKYLNLKLIAKFLRDYHHMPYKDRTTILAAVLVLLALPVAIMFFRPDTSSVPLDLAPLDVASPCYVTGCADQLCLDAKIAAPVDHCPQQPAFACLSHSRCERQPSGRCGWTQTPEYLSCIRQLPNKP